MQLTPSNKQKVLANHFLASMELGDQVNMCTSTVILTIQLLIAQKVRNHILCDKSWESSTVSDLYVQEVHDKCFWMDGRMGS